MKPNITSLDYKQLPQFIEESTQLLTFLKQLTYNEAKSIWQCNDKIATLNYQRIQKMDLYTNLSPAILSYQGIQYQYMASNVFTNEEYSYIERHLRIMSGFYGMLRPFDGVVPYRLEMQANLKGEALDSLYNFWNEKLAKQLFSECKCIINLASKEYSQCISNYLDSRIQFITCIFGERLGDKVLQKGTQVKMARGEMVRFMAENQITNIEAIKTFNRSNYIFAQDLSTADTLVFIKKSVNK